MPILPYCFAVLSSNTQLSLADFVLSVDPHFDLNHGKTQHSNPVHHGALPV